MEIQTQPLYLQVVDLIEEKIENNVFQPSEKLPPEEQLSKQLGVSRSTLREALRVLEDEKILSRKHGVGTFVNAKPIFSSGIEKLKSITHMISQSGKEPGSRYLSIELLSPTKNDRNRFMLEQGEKILKIERVRTADGEPIVYCVDKLPGNIITISDFKKIKEEISIFDLLKNYANKRISYAVANIESVISPKNICKALHCEAGQPLLQLKQMHYTDSDESILYSTNYFRSDFFSFNIIRKRH